MIAYSKSHTYHVTKTINAPLNFVYDWCTDYREDDNQIAGSQAKFKILQKTKQRVIYLRTCRLNQKTMAAVKIVTLRPPKAWLLDQVGEDEDACGTYRLTELSRTKTRLNVKITEKYKIIGTPSKEEDKRATDQMWSRYVAALEKEYASSINQQ
ncbi:MAG TPA: hypothetical protein VLV18_08255 [Terriglobales bacterium]|nr:hypothetical protein [Terriglobales bacterium]